MDFSSTLRVLAKHKLLVAVLLVLTLGGVGWAVRDRAAREAEIAREREDRGFSHVDSFHTGSGLGGTHKAWPA